MFNENSINESFSKPFTSHEINDFNYYHKSLSKNYHLIWNITDSLMKPTKKRIRTEHSNPASSIESLLLSRVNTKAKKINLVRFKLLKQNTRK